MDTYAILPNLYISSVAGEVIHWFWVIFFAFVFIYILGTKSIAHKANIIYVCFVGNITAINDENTNILYLK